MARIVCVHGAFHELWGPHQIGGRWIPALRDGLALVGHDVDPADVAIAFYGDLFRPEADARIADDELREIARRTGILDAATAMVGEEGLPQLVEMIGREQLRRTLAQLGRYFDDDDLRAAVQARVATHISPDTRLVIAHSLGTIVSYETLVGLPGPAHLDLVTLGSPLGHRGVIGADLRPAPGDGAGVWPDIVRRWTNVIAVGDLAAEGFPVAGVFDGAEERRVDNGQRAHDPEPYICARETAEAVAAALTGWH